MKHADEEKLIDCLTFFDKYEELVENATLMDTLVVLKQTINVFKVEHILADLLNKNL